MASACAAFFASTYGTLTDSRARVCVCARVRVRAHARVYVRVSVQRVLHNCVAKRVQP